MTGRRSVEDRFWSKVDRTETCWNWTGARHREGYGLFHLDRSVKRAHRVAYELLVGPIPDGLVIDHLCRNTSCVNPAHLEPVTQAENTRRGAAGSNMRSRTHCVNGHEFTPENTALRRGGQKRECMTCIRARRKAWRRSELGVAARKREAVARRRRQRAA